MIIPFFETPASLVQRLMSPSIVGKISSSTGDSSTRVQTALFCFDDKIRAFPLCPHLDCLVYHHKIIEVWYCSSLIVSQTIKCKQCMKIVECSVEVLISVPFTLL